MTNKPIPIKPGPGRVLLARNRVPYTTKGGLAIPEEKRREMEKANFRAEVLAVGDPDESGVQAHFKEGDEVFIDNNAGYRLELEGTDMVLTVARFCEVMGVFDPEWKPEAPPEPLVIVPERPSIIIP